MPTMYFVDLAPVLIVAGWGVLILVLDIFIPEERKGWAAWVSLVGLTAALVQTMALWGYSNGTFTPQGGSPMLLVDNYATFLNIIFILTGILGILIAVGYLDQHDLERPEFYMLLLFSVSGMMLMGMANDLILIFLALEVLSIPLYIMSGLSWTRTESEESAMKYFLLGAFSSSILVFGIALMYGATGSTALPEVATAVTTGSGLALAGSAFLLVGFAFKVGAVPFHMWTPDVYEGAPTVTTAFMSVGAKVGGFAALLRIFVTALPELADTWVGAVAILSALTLILGNVVAIRQQNIKRMLAYSSIAHAGYILIAVAATAGSADGVSAALFYMFAYLFTNMGAFAVVIALERKLAEGNLLDDYKGLANRNPWLALAMAYFMLSLTGIPPTGGFSGKFFVFRTAVEADLIWLAVIGVVTSVVSGFYYLRIVYLMYMYPGDEEVPTRAPLQLGLAISVLVTVLLGFLPGTWFDMAREAALTAVQVVAGG